MGDRVVLMSFKPRYAQRIIDGRKHIELRRARPSFGSGTIVLIYTTAPICQIQGVFVVNRLIEGTVGSLWRRFREALGVSRQEYLTYFDGRQIGFGISIRTVRPMKASITLSHIRSLWPEFIPPQSYRFLNQSVKAHRELLRSCKAVWQQFRVCNGSNGTGF